MSQTLTVRSMLPEAMRRPSGLNATQNTPAVCPRRVKTSSPVVVSHSLMVRSSLPVARRRPSGLQASPSTNRGVSAKVEHSPRGKVPDLHFTELR